MVHCCSMLIVLYFALIHIVILKSNCSFQLFFHYMLKKFFELFGL